MLKKNVGRLKYLRSRRVRFDQESSKATSVNNFFVTNFYFSSKNLNYFSNRCFFSFIFPYSSASGS